MLTVRTSENTVITSFRLITERQDFSSVRTAENTVRARARIHSYTRNIFDMGGTMSDRLSYAEKEELPTSVYGLPERREYPMPDAAHVRAAEAYFRYCPEELKPELARAILKRAKEFGVDVESPTVLQYAAE